MKLLIATTSEHKLREIAGLLCDVPSLQLLSLRDVPPLEMPEETEPTMRGNARLKAMHATRATGLPTLADDSGLEVDALDGAPGVRSARWVEGSDDDRLHALLAAMHDVPDRERAARYRCALCLAWPLGGLLTYEGELLREETEGTCEGRIARAARGLNGFGYDPIFELAEATGASEWIGRTMAETPPEVKAQVSHRARAVSAVVPILRELSRS